ncbi:MAG: M48 family metalloprotease [Myxococcota bacterium]
MRAQHLRLSSAFACAIMAGLGLGCAINPVTGTPDYVLMSEEDEIALGDQTRKEVLQAQSLYADPEIAARVEEIGQALAANSHRPGIEYRFGVLDSEEVNAFALPGGHIFITRGLLAHLNSDAELAAVLGHEIGHVAARHAVRQHSKTQTARPLAYVASIFARAYTPGYVPLDPGNLADLLGGVILSGYGREHELEADRLGAEYLIRLGYDPKALLRVIGFLKDQEQFEIERAREEEREPRVYHGLFATHPSQDARLREVVESAGSPEIEKPRPENSESFLKLLDGLTWGPSSDRGVVRGRHFYHSGLGFALSFPRDWFVQNQGQQLLAIAPGNEAALELSIRDRGSHTTPEEFLRWEMRVAATANTAAYRVAGLPAFTAVARRDTTWGRRDVRIIVMFVGTRAYVFQGATRDYDELAHYDRHFFDTAGSFHALSERERARTRGPQLRTVRAKPDTRYEDLARQSPVDHPEQTLRILNGDYPDREPVSGSLIKVVR